MSGVRPVSCGNRRMWPDRTKCLRHSSDQPIFDRLLREVHKTRQIRNRFPLAWLLAMSSFVLPVAAVAEAQPIAAIKPIASIEEVEIGFGGYYKAGRWAPLVVHVRCLRPITAQLVVQVSDPDGCLTALPSDPVKLESAGRHRLRTSFRCGRLEGDVVIRLVDASRSTESSADGPTVWDERRWRVTSSGEHALRPALKQSALLWATLGNPAGFQTSQPDNGSVQGRPAPSHSSQTEGSAVYVAELAAVDQLPVRPRDFDSLDALILAGQYDLGEGQNAAVRDWVRSGGHLIVAVGTEPVSYRNSRLAQWVPVAVAETPLRLADTSLTGLESFAGKDQKILMSGRVEAAHLQTTEGEVLVPGLDAPLLVRVPYGFGRVTFLGLDLDRPPLQTWAAVGSFCRKMVGAETDEDSTTGGRRLHGRLSHSGITELATQLHAIQEHFPDVSRSSSWTVMGLMFVYLILIGPLDYLLVHRVLKRPRATWITFPTMVVVAISLTVWGANVSNGNRLRINQLDLVDIDVHSGWVRSHDWTTLYSTEHRRYHTAIRPRDDQWTGAAVRKTQPATRRDDNPAVADIPPTVSWSGIPESVYGGMYRPAGFEIGRPEYRFSPGATAIESLPVAIWSTKGLTATWDYASKSAVDSSLHSSGSSKLSGSLTHHFPVPISDWVVAHANTVYLPAARHRPDGDVLHPGDVWDPSDASVVYSRELRGFLTGKTRSRVERQTGVGADILVDQARYDPLNRDADSLLQMLTFHEAAGGQGYTGLHNHTLRQLDLSPMLMLGRAVLFGRIDLPAAELELDGQPVQPTRRATFIRILLPVQDRSVQLRDLPDFDNPGSSLP